MSPAEFRSARLTLGLTSVQLAALLGVTPLQVRRMQVPADSPTNRPIHPSAERLVQALLDGYRPADWPFPVSHDECPRCSERARQRKEQHARLKERYREKITYTD